MLAGQPGPLASFYGYPAPFGHRLNATAVQAPLVLAPGDGCGGGDEGPALPPAVIPFSAAVVPRGNCSFTQKARALQEAGYAAMLLFNNEPGE